MTERTKPPGWIIEHAHEMRPVIHLGGDEAGVTECGVALGEHGGHLTAVTVMTHCLECVRQRKAAALTPWPL